MPLRNGQPFSRQILRLSPGGTHNFNAVSVDGATAAAISTSGALTASGKMGSGKLLKLRSDMLFLLMANVERRILVLKENDMFELCLREKANGRVPKEIEFDLAQIPPELAERLRQARDVASREVAPHT